MAKGLDQADTWASTMRQRQGRVSVGQQMVPTQGQRDGGMSEDMTHIMSAVVELNRPVEGDPPRHRWWWIVSIWQ